MSPADGVLVDLGGPEINLPEDVVLPFVGRTVERATLQRGLSRASSGQKFIVLIEGQAGIGKSRLLDFAATAANGLRFRICRVTVEEVGQDRAFGAIVDALGVIGCSHPELSSLARSLIAYETDTGARASERTPSLSNAVIEDVLASVQHLSSECPLAVVIDDAHWADTFSLVALQALARERPNLPLALLVAFRPLVPGSRRERLLRRLRQHGAVHIHLGPLDDESVMVLATAAAGHPLGIAAGSILEATEGNPLVTIEVARGLAASGALAESEPANVNARLSASESASLCRQAALSDDTLDLLTFCSVLASPFDVYELSSITGRTIVDLFGPLEQAVRWGVLKEARSRLAFRHDVVREALYRRLPLALRRALHVHAAWRLADAGVPAVAVSDHLARGASVGDPRALTWLTDAAREAILRAPREAVELLERALLLTDGRDARRGMLVADLCVALRLSGRVREANELARRELMLPKEPALEGRLRATLISGLLDQGRAADAQEEVRAALQHLDDGEAVAPSLMAAAASGQLVSGELEGARDLANRAKAAADGLGDDFSLGLAEQVSCTVALLQGRTREAVNRGRGLAERAKRNAGTRMYLTNIPLALALTDADELDEAAQTLLAGMTITRHLAVPSNQFPHHLALAKLRYLSGDWVGAIADAEAALRMTDEFDIRRGVVIVHAVLALIALHRNDLAGGEAHLLAGERRLAWSSPEFGGSWIHWARGQFEDARGREEDALAALHRAWAVAWEFGAHCEYPLFGPGLVHLLVRNGEAGQAQARAAEIDVVVCRMEVPWAEGARLRARGLATNDPGMVLRAVQVERESRRPLQKAEGAEAAAAVLALGGRTNEATQLLEEALSHYAILDAKRDVARTRAELRRLGIRVKPPRSVGTKRLSARGWDALTASELQVVRLIGQGLSYRQAAGQLFISPRTVETHVSHAMAKLDCSSRSELRAELARRQA